jgi:tRNA modification GTPase
MTRAPDTDTIAAVATPSGRGGIGILRLSGAAVTDIAATLLGRLPPPRHARLATFRDADGADIDQGIALYFPAPNSFTGEDVLELHGHGGAVVLDQLLQAALAAGARLARPGEFSERAFLNGKLDLAQAEAVADLIDSGSAAAARSALHSLQGGFSRRVNAVQAMLVELRTYIEAAIDFPEEEIDFLADPQLAARTENLVDQIDALLHGAEQGRLLRDGMTVVIAGRPNAGKSSLMNVLADHDTAIVSATPGTTRDLLREHVQIDGLPLHLVDTAGLRDAGDEIESEGVRRARAAMEQADLVLWVADDSSGAGAQPDLVADGVATGVPCIVVYNKIDLSGREPGLIEHGGDTALAISAATSAGIDALRAHLKQCMGYGGADESLCIARRRHVDAARRARGHVETALTRLQERSGELAAEELRLAQQALGEITGEFTSEDLLGQIFSTFCIGK